jgi:thymidylate kinase
MTEKVKLLVIEGLDRTGKDTLAEHFEEYAVLRHRHNNLGRGLDKEYYEITRSNMKDSDPYYVSAITSAMAVSEFIQLLSFIKRCVVRHGRRSFVVPRLFPSTVVFDAVRGIQKRTRLEANILKMKERFEKENDIEIDMRLLTLFANRDTMIQRGSTEDSFEIKNYDKIVLEFLMYTQKEIDRPVMFSKSGMMDVSSMTEEEVYEFANTFLFSS